jgi:hypothetical protein
MTKYFPKIVGEKVYLSPLHPEDYEIFTKRMNDSRITDGTGATCGLITLVSERRWIDEMITKKPYIYLFYCEKGRQSITWKY